MRQKSENQKPSSERIVKDKRDTIQNCPLQHKGKPLNLTQLASWSLHRATP
jgi:hypothetical protein